MANMNLWLQQVYQSKGRLIEKIKFWTLSNKYFHIVNQRVWVSLINKHLKLQVFVLLYFTLSLSCCIEMFPFIQNFSFLGTIWESWYLNKNKAHFRALQWHQKQKIRVAYVARYSHLLLRAPNVNAPYTAL